MLAPVNSEGGTTVSIQGKLDCSEEDEVFQRAKPVKNFAFENKDKLISTRQVTIFCFAFSINTGMEITHSPLLPRQSRMWDLLWNVIYFFPGYDLKRKIWLIGKEEQEGNTGHGTFKSDKWSVERSI